MSRCTDCVRKDCCAAGTDRELDVQAAERLLRRHGRIRVGEREAGSYGPGSKDGLFWYDEDESYTSPVVECATAREAADAIIPPVRGEL